MKSIWDVDGEKVFWSLVVIIVVALLTYYLPRLF